MREEENVFGAPADELPEPERSKVVPAAAAAIGAAIGSLPGCLLWIYVGGAVSIAAFGAAVLAGGAFAGGRFAASAVGYKEFGKACRLVCFAIAIAASLYCARSCVTRSLAKYMESSVGSYREAKIKELTYEGLSESEAAAEASEEACRREVCRQFGVREISRAEASVHFGELIKKLDLRTEYAINLFICLAVAASCAFGSYARTEDPGGFGSKRRRL